MSRHDEEPTFLVVKVDGAIEPLGEFTHRQDAYKSLRATALKFAREDDATTDLAGRFSGTSGWFSCTEQTFSALRDHPYVHDCDETQTYEISVNAGDGREIKWQVRAVY